MTEKKWEIFEKIIAKIYEIKLSDFQTEIKHNIILEGKSGVSHQIDVLVELSIPLMKIREIIEVKHWQSRVNKSIVMQINEIYDDVNANRATIISRKGFQKGAIQYATHHGISLYQILTPKELGVHTFVHIKRFIGPEVVNVQINLQAKNDSQLNEAFVKEHERKNYSEVTIYDANERPVANIFDLINETFKDLKKASKFGIKKTVSFHNCFIKVNGRKEKINSVEIVAEMKYVEEEEKVEDVEKTKLLIRDVVNNMIFEVDRPIGFEMLDET